MKEKLLAICIILSSVTLKAQITLTSANAPTLTVLQTQDTANSVKLSGLPDLSAKTNATWDMSVAVDSFLFYNFNAPASNPAFPDAKFSIGKYYAFAGALKYFTTALYSVTASGVLQHGESLERQAISIKLLSGGANDSLIFPKQDIVFSTESVEIKHPSSMSSTWSATPKLTTNFQLTVVAYGLNKTPGQRRSLRGDTYTVVGWGKMRVNDKSGQPTQYIDVLQVKLERSVTDSFYLGGSPAPPQLLTAFGLTQGQVLKTYEMIFLRKGEFKPLVKVSYTNNTYTKVNYCEVHKQRFNNLSGTASLTSTALEVYPNPVTGHSFSIQGDNVAGKNLKFALCNNLGQVMVSAEVPSDGVVNLPETISAGLYHLQLMDKDQILSVKKLHISN